VDGGILPVILLLTKNTIEVRKVHVNGCCNVVSWEVDVTLLLW
jgi:hypothetical protein